MKKIFTDEMLDYMIANYQTMEYKDIAEHIGLTSKQVRTKMSQLGYRKYRTFNNRYFQNIDTPLKAYFLGFIFADGWICANPEIRNYEFGIELQSGDRYILDKLNEELGNVHKIYHTEPEKAIICGKIVNRGHTDTLRVYSKPLVEDLIVNGISTNKTQKDIVPHVSDEFFFDFLRGYIDGDGCYWNTRQRPNDIYLHITCASKSVLEYLQNRLTSYNIKSQIYTEADKKHRLMCTNYNDMHFLINKMYKDENTFCLTRKLKLIEKYLDYREAS